MMGKELTEGYHPAYIQAWNECLKEHCYPLEAEVQDLRLSYVTAVCQAQEHLEELDRLREAAQEAILANVHERDIKIMALAALLEADDE